MLKGKQRASLKSLANNLEVMSHIGKEGITDSVKAYIRKFWTGYKRYSQYISTRN